MFDLTELALGAAVAAIVVHLCHIRRTDTDVLRLHADLRSEREHHAEMAAQLAERDARIADQAAQLARAADREAVAAANILQLSGALLAAAGQVGKPAAAVAIAADLRDRFCRN